MDISSLDSTSPQRHWSASGQCHNVTRQVSESLSNCMAGCRDSRGSSMHATIGTKKNGDWVGSLWQRDGLGRWRGWLDGWRGGRKERKRLLSSKLLAKLRLFKVWRKDSLGVAPGSLGIPFSGTSPVENHFLAPHCRELETFCWQAWHSSPSAFLFLCQALYSTIFSNPPSSSSTAVHERPTKPSTGVKA